ncbi:MAG: asparagine synthase (glutamine-hydrolyzing) [Sphingobacterium sp.]
MCGLAGFFRKDNTPGRENHEAWLEAMGNAILHRGPDAGGVYIDPHIGLVHRRLSIIDLTSAGNQPMESATGRYVICFNGEIYNYRKLRSELEEEGIQFQTHTDTEVLLALFEKYGEECLGFLNGMFAIAIWDKTKRELFLARDRLGKKPLYYFQAAGEFGFGSEIKALKQLPFLRTDIRMDALKDFFVYQYIPDPKSIYKQIYKLPPGHWMKTDGRSLTIKQYWDVDFSKHSMASVEDITAELYDLVEDAVRLRMVSDVPLGAFLSGGIDSSAIVGLMARNSTQPVTTCSIGFDSKEFDEVQFAERVARQFHTDHHEFTVRDNVADDLVAITRFFDEPFADPSFVPTFFVSQLARRQVTVALAGDGGDENFAGYSKYRVDQIENQLRGLAPQCMRRVLLPPLSRLAGKINHPSANKAQSLLSTLSIESNEAFFLTNSFFRQSVWEWLINDRVRQETSGYHSSQVTIDHYNAADTDDHLSRILYTDLKTYLPGDILVKVDRMSMANSLETRAPLLDYRVVEYAATIPSKLKLHGKEKKYVLKEAFSGLLTEETLYRKKMGFSVPLSEWLRQQLRETAAGIFSNSNGGLSHFFQMQRVGELWHQHLRGDDRHTQELWSLLMFELWFQAYEA